MKRYIDKAIEINLRDKTGQKLHPQSFIIRCQSEDDCIVVEFRKKEEEIKRLKKTAVSDQAYSFGYKQRSVRTVRVSEELMMDVIADIQFLFSFCQFHLFKFSYNFIIIFFKSIFK